MRHRIYSRLAAILAIAATLLLTGCGGGGGAAALLSEVGSGGTGGPVFGILTGFGSLIVDGIRRDDTLASYLSEEDQGRALPMAPTAVMLGHSLEFNTDASDRIMSVMVSPELLGPATAVGVDSLTVLGTRVIIHRDTTQGPATVLLGYAAPSAIQVGDRIAVYGLLTTDAQGAATLQATLISLKPAGTAVRLTGYVSQYDAGAGSFALGGMTVKLGSATSTTLSPAGAKLANGALVTVWSDAAPIGNTLSASTIRVKTPASSGTLTLSGIISGFTSAASFKIRNVTVDASKATLIPGGVTLADNRYVVVTGQYDASANKLAASSVTLYAPDAAVAVELHGSILNFVSPASFTVRGVAVDASGAAVTGGTLSQLGNNVFVEVIGAVADSVVKATTLRIVSFNPLNAPGGAMLDLGGTIASFDAATGGYTMTMASGLSVSGKLGSSMFFNNGGAANLAVGQAVYVRGMMQGGTLATSVVSFTPTVTAPITATPPTPGAPPAPPVTHMEGIISNVTATSFMLNGLTIQRNGVPIQGGGMMGGGMTSGMRVGVDVQLLGGQYLATAISLHG